MPTGFLLRWQRKFQVGFAGDCLGESVTTKSQGPYLEYGYLSRNPSVMEGGDTAQLLGFLQL